MKKILIVLSLTTSALSFAQTDYSLCNKFIEDNNQNFQKTNNGNYFPFKLDDKTGAVVTTNLQLNSVKTDKSVEYSLQSTTGPLKITAFIGDGGKIARVETLRVGSGFTANNSIEFNIEGEKCFPKISYNDFTSSGQKVRATTFDTLLCKRLQDYFEANSSLEKCLSLESKENKDLGAIFKEHGYDVPALLKNHGLPTSPSFVARMNYSVEQKVIVGNPDLVNTGDQKKNVRGMAIAGGTPIMSGFMILNDCYDKGLYGVLHDDKILKNSEEVVRVEAKAKAIKE